MSKKMAEWYGCSCKDCATIIYSNFTPTLNANTMNWDIKPTHCGLCGEERENYMCGQLPEYLIKLLNTNAVCHFCRNSICFAVMKDFGLCWGKASIEAIATAILYKFVKDLNSRIYVSAKIKKGTWYTYA